MPPLDSEAGERLLLWTCALVGTGVPVAGAAAAVVLAVAGHDDFQVGLVEQMELHH